MTQKLYRFLFCKQTGLYKGLTYEQPWPENSTVIQPHFEAGFKSVFDLSFGGWKLVPQEVFFKQMNSIDEIKNVVELKNEDLKNRMNREFTYIRDETVGCLISNFAQVNETIAARFSLMNSASRDYFLCLEKAVLDNEKTLERCYREFGHLEDMLIEIRDAQKDHYLYSRKSYWTSRFIDVIANFYVRGRDIFFKFFQP